MGNREVQAVLRLATLAEATLSPFTTAMASQRLAAIEGTLHVALTTLR